jgi:alkanesulfonate monooxygenase SsuD/methylene tetrahydromethanopterin reductase-like flavin-dependent oxidoreductase (luciferase family)
MTLLFGLNVSTDASPGADPVARAQVAESLGFDFVSANDHPCGTRPTHECWTMLSWIAARTSRIKVATRVLGIPYRPPAIVAKMAATLSQLSGGRLILGLGGGASDEEFRAFGLRVPTPREKVDGLEEAVRIIRGLWSEPKFTFEGRLFRTESADLEPKPEHRIPIWLGTFGPRALDVTGRLADGWIPSLEMAPPDRVVSMRERVLRAAREAGRDPQEITWIYNLQVMVGERDPRAHVVSGSPAQVADRLLDLAGLGLQGMNFLTVGPEVDEQAERLAKEVLPAVRSGAA